MTGIQRTAEATIGGVQLLERAAQCKDSIKRLIFATTGALSAYQTMKIRKRKPFNPMLGETYELVMENFRFVCEKVSH